MPEHPMNAENLMDDFLSFDEGASTSGPPVMRGSRNPRRITQAGQKTRLMTLWRLPAA